MILQVIGKQKELDVSFLETEEALQHLKGMSKGMPKKKDSLLAKMDPNDSFVELLRSMLEFNPYLRLSADELLKHRLFDDIRHEKNHVHSKSKLLLSIDKDAMFNSQDFSFNTSPEELH